MKNRSVAVALFMALILGTGAFAQTISFGLGDADLDADLNSLNASAQVNLAGFQAEVSLAWGQPAASITLALSQGLSPAEVYFAAALSKLSGNPISVVIDLYKSNKSKGWGALAKELGIKPGSKEFKLLKEKLSGSAAKLKSKK